MLAAALRWHIRGRALHELEQRLLHALARDVADDRRAVGFAGNLVDLVDIDDAALRALDVVVGRLQQLENNVLDVLADIASFRERRRIGDGERNIENARLTTEFCVSASATGAAVAADTPPASDNDNPAAPKIGPILH